MYFGVDMKNISRNFVFFNQKILIYIILSSFYGITFCRADQLNYEDLKSHPWCFTTNKPPRLVKYTFFDNGRVVRQAYIGSQLYQGPLTGTFSLEPNGSLYIPSYYSLPLKVDIDRNHNKIIFPDSDKSIKAEIPSPGYCE